MCRLAAPACPPGSPSAGAWPPSRCVGHHFLIAVGWASPETGRVGFRWDWAEDAARPLGAPGRVRITRACHGPRMLAGLGGCQALAPVWSGRWPWAQGGQALTPAPAFNTVVGCREPGPLQAAVARACAPCVLRQVPHLQRGRGEPRLPGAARRLLHGPDRERPGAPAPAAHRLPRPQARERAAGQRR